MTRKSTQKYEVVHLTSGVVVLEGVSKTDATIICREMNKGDPRKGCSIRPSR